MTCDHKNNPCTAQCSAAACTETRVELEGGKYIVVIGSNGGLHALRYGEKWQDMTGNKMIYCLASELHATRQALAASQAREASWERSAKRLLEGS